ncbi:MAG TPA: serine/threonine-protein kinase [Saprospiraceae bacterium]|nr:serine/threonine-protein kinase [Saprospiraceae bacterium]
MAKSKPWDSGWQIGEKLGSGGQGDTHIARRKEDGKQLFALKTLRNNSDDDRRERMYVEVANLRILDHLHIPQFIESNVEDYKDKNVPLYLVTEYVPGPTLQQFIENNGALDLDSALTLVVHLTDVLAYCHNKNAYHRDIKPDNIILRDWDINEPYLIDFGLSFNSEIPKVDETPSWQHIGNRFLSLPELRVIEGNKRDHRSDVTSICGILLFCLTGMHPTDLIDGNNAKPHRRERSIEILQKIPQKKIQALNKVFDIGFNTAINDRWQSIESLKNSLIDLLNLHEEDMEEESDLNKKLEHFKKSVEGRHDFKQNKELDNLHAQFVKILMSTNDMVINELSDNFGRIQSRRAPDYVKQVFSERVGITHKYSEALQFFPWFTLYINGSEIVIEANESENRVELLRHPLNEVVDWLSLQQRIRNYYVDGLISKNKLAQR